MKAGLLIFAARVSRTIDSDYGLNGFMMDSPTAQYSENFIHDYFIDCDGTTKDVSDCAFLLANDIQSGKARESIIRATRRAP